MKEHPILFSTEMVLAILAGRKTQTRRVIKLKSMKGFENEIASIHKDGSGNGWIAWSPKPVSAEETMRLYPSNEGFKCPYGSIGDILWVRETWQKVSTYSEPDCFGKYLYMSMGDNSEKWKPSIHMPKDACLIFLKNVNIRVERLQDISEIDAIAEGITEYAYGYWKNYLSDFCGVRPKTGIDFKSPIDSFKSLWQKINGTESWNENPFVWVIEFEHCQKPKH